MSNNRKPFSWEGDQSRIWSDFASLSSISEKLNRKKIKERRKLNLLQPLKRGLIRNLMIIVDASSNMLEVDYPPNRIDTFYASLRKFLKSFMEQNPLSKVGLILTKNSTAHIHSPINSGVDEHLKILKNLPECSGFSSLQNGLELAFHCLKACPSHSKREILVLYGSNTTIDPSNIFESIHKISQNEVRVDCVGLSGEFHILRKISERTGGVYRVAMDNEHVHEILGELILPPESNPKDRNFLIHAHFPAKIPGPIRCFCHAMVNANAFQCPNCKGIVCSVPGECPICNSLHLSSSHLAKNLRNLFLVPNLVETDVINACVGCNEIEKSNFKCEECYSTYCNECESLIKGHLFNCIGCLRRER